jgi:hypothetical protein
MEAVAVAFRGLWKNTTGISAKEVRNSGFFCPCLQCWKKKQGKHALETGKRPSDLQVAAEKYLVPLILHP